MKVCCTESMAAWMTGLSFVPPPVLPLQKHAVPRRCRSHEEVESVQLTGWKTCTDPFETSPRTSVPETPPAYWILLTDMMLFSEPIVSWPFSVPNMTASPAVQLYWLRSPGMGTGMLDGYG